MSKQTADPPLRIKNDRDKIIYAIRESQEFRTSGNFRAIVVQHAFSTIEEMKRHVGYMPTGDLNPAARAQFEADRYNLEYVVYSYDTPIFWRTRSKVEQFVDDFFNNTTSKHQAIIREYWEKTNK